jgi:putative aldouronate transport system permease protein
MASVTSNGTVRVKKKPLGQRMSKYWGFYLMFIPVLAFVAVFHYAPMFGIRYAFYSWKIVGDPQWVGLANFEKLFKQSQFSVAFTNTIVFSVVKLLLNTGLAVIISLLLNEMLSLKFKKLSQTVIYLPHFMSWVVTASVFSLLLSPSDSGLVNQLLIKLGLIDESVYYLADKGWWRVWYYLINLWRETGWQTIIFMATLTGIDPGIYEAASIDGAGRWKKMRYVTLPALANTIITVLILNLAKIMNLFESVFVLQNDSVKRATNVLQTYVYYQTFNAGASADYGYTTAIGLFRSLVGLALMLICNYASKRVRGRGIV